MGKLFKHINLQVIGSLKYCQLESHSSVSNIAYNCYFKALNLMVKVSNSVYKKIVCGASKVLRES